MKFLTPRQYQPGPAPDMAGIMALTEQLEEVREHRGQLTRWLGRLEWFEQNAAGALEREKGRCKRGVRDTDLPLAERLSETATTEAKSQRKLVLEAGAQVAIIEQAIIDKADLPALEAEIKHLEAEEKKFKGAYEMAVLGNLAGSKQNGNLETSRSALRASRRDIDAVKKAIATATGVIRSKACQKAIAESLPRIEALVARRNEAINNLQLIDGEIVGELDQLKKQHNYQHPGWPVLDIKRIREQEALGISQLKQEA